MKISKCIYFFMAILLVNITLIRDLKLNQLVVEGSYETNKGLFSFFTEDDSSLAFVGDEFSETGEEEEEEEEEKKEKENDTEDDDLFFDTLNTNLYIIIPFQFTYNYCNPFSKFIIAKATPPPQIV